MDSRVIQQRSHSSSPFSTPEQIRRWHRAIRQAREVAGSDMRSRSRVLLEEDASTRVAGM